MPNPPNRRRHVDPRDAAEALFKPKPPKAPEPPKTPSSNPAGHPAPKETVSLRIDRDVLAHFQEDGPGWQDRINDALRRASGK